MKPISVDDITAIRTEGDLREALAAILTDARAHAERNRRMVMAHPDLAARLTEPPCSFSRPEAWTGYIAPAHTEGRYGTVHRNTSPYRAQLVAIVSEAWSRTVRSEPTL